jgi:uncharacterized membrane protein YsdA (DUF1294 family)
MKLFLYIVFINIVTFFVYYYDKSQAERGGWRISEKTLHILAFIGGSLGAFLGMKKFRHKTKKSSFKVIFWLIITIQIIYIFLQAGGYKL